MAKKKQPELDIDEVEAIIEWQDRMATLANIRALYGKTNKDKVKQEKISKTCKEKLRGWIEYRNTKWPK